MSASPRFFFFQAEDGIRDVAVTGVQTCALPISERDAHGPGTDKARSRSPIVTDRGPHHTEHRRAEHHVKGDAPMLLSTTWHAVLRPFIAWRLRFYRSRPRRQVRRRARCPMPWELARDCGP